MNIKSIAAVLALSLASSLASSPAFAEPPHGRGSMLDELDLSEAQREQIEEIRAAGGGRDEIHAVLTPEQQERARELRKDRHGKRADRMRHMREELDLSDDQVSQIETIFKSGGGREETRESIRAVLTEEQRDRFDDMKKHHKGGHKGGHKGKNRDSDSP